MQEPQISHREKQGYSDGGEWGGGHSLASSLPAPLASPVHADMNSSKQSQEALHWKGIGFWGPGREAVNCGREVSGNR